MEENLKVTHYPNGTAIPNITINGFWGILEDNNTDDAYCYCDNNISNANLYGALYSWAAAMGDNAISSTTNPSGVQGVCPYGWHLPSDDEWKQLEMQLGMSQSEADQTEWHGTDQGSQLADSSALWSGSYILENNSQFGTSGFTALPGGYRDSGFGTFRFLEHACYWWSSTETYSLYAWSRQLSFGSSKVYRYDFSKSHGFSVRCLKD